MESANKTVGRTIVNRTKNAVSSGYQSTKNASVNAYRDFQRSSSITKIFIVVLILLILCVIVYWLAHAYESAKYTSSSSPYLITTPVNVFNKKFSPVSVPDPTEGMAYSYSFWMYISDWNYRIGEPKVILIKGTEYENTNASPIIGLDPVKNTLNIGMRTYSSGTGMEYCNVDNIPIQKWVHVAYVLDNRVSDVYIDGKLERSCILKKLPWLNNDDMWLIPNQMVGADSNVGGKLYGFMGQLSSVRYFSKALQPVDVARLYNQGPHVTKGLKTKDTSQDAGTGGGIAPLCPQYHPGTEPDTASQSMVGSVSNDLQDVSGSVSNDLQNVRGSVSKYL